MKRLDDQLAAFVDELRDNLGINGDAARKVVTTIAAELRFLTGDLKGQILHATPVDVKYRLSELVAFQSFMDLVSRERETHPAVVRAQVVYQSYVCFVYLGESLFKILAKSAPQKSVARKCARFLTENPVRAFRNAVAHGNWRYRDDFSGLIFWARPGSDPAESLRAYEVGQRELDFWQTLARGIAYAAYPHLMAGAD